MSKLKSPSWNKMIPTVIKCNFHYTWYNYPSFTGHPSGCFSVFETSKLQSVTARFIAELNPKNVKLNCDTTRTCFRFLTKKNMWCTCDNYVASQNPGPCLPVFLYLSRLLDVESPPKKNGPLGPAVHWESPPPPHRALVTLDDWTLAMAAIVSFNGKHME